MRANYITYPNSEFYIKNECIVLISGLWIECEKARFAVYAEDNSDQKLVIETTHFYLYESRRRRAVITNQPKDHETFSQVKRNLFQATIAYII